MTENDRHLSIDDVPISSYGAHEQEMLKRANRQGELALQAVGAGHFKQASGYFQACLALYQEAIILTRSNLQNAARLAALHDARARDAAETPAMAEPDWPIPSLINFSARSDEGWESPRWGVSVPAAGPPVNLSIVPAAEDETMQLHIELHGRYEVVTFTRRHWDALNRLAQRVLSGDDIPASTIERP